VEIQASPAARQRRDAEIIAAARAMPDILDCDGVTSSLQYDRKGEQSSCWSRTSAGLPFKAFSTSNNFNIVWPIK
jgi:hypothetical protein